MEQWNAVISYIEAHLTEDITVEAIARNVGLSSYHLKRTFSFFAGMTLSEYLKKRRLSRASQDLAEGASVTETAFKYGFGSLEGFSRAFKAYSGIAPSKVQETQQLLHFPPLRFRLTIEGGHLMELKIVEKAAFQLVGVTARVPIQFEGENEAIKALAHSITPQQRGELHELMDQAPHQVVNASYQFTEGRMEEKGELTHLIGVITNQENPYPDLETVAVPALTWAIFPNRGPFPQTLQETWGQIYAQWLPDAGYHLVEAPEISFSDFSGGSQDVYSEIWLAVTKKT